MEKSRREGEHDDTKAIEEYLRSFPPGYTFKPRDSELVISYLQPKIDRKPLPINLMHEVNIYDYSPDYLAENWKAQGEKIWYFFTSRDKKYPKGSRPARNAGDGYWKATGKDKVIKNEKEVEIGFRKALVYYKGKPPRGQKTPWIMHEFRVSGSPHKDNKRKRSEGTSMRLDDHILCRIYNKEESGIPSPRIYNKEESGIPSQKGEVHMKKESDVKEDHVSSSVDSAIILASNNTNTPESSLPSEFKYYSYDNYDNNNNNIYHCNTMGGFYETTISTDQGAGFSNNNYLPPNDNVPSPSADFDYDMDGEITRYLSTPPPPEMKMIMPPMAPTVHEDMWHLETMLDSF